MAMEIVWIGFLEPLLISMERCQSLIMTRGYYTRTYLTAWDFRKGKLTKRWAFDSDDPESNRPYRGQGNHNLSVADVDADGKDEIVFGAMTIDDKVWLCILRVWSWRMHCMLPILIQPGRDLKYSIYRNGLMMPVRT